MFNLRLVGNDLVGPVEDAGDRSERDAPLAGHLANGYPAHARRVLIVAAGVERLP
jgi:hypothetical protein